jgi:hypothetical protein
MGLFDFIFGGDEVQTAAATPGKYQEEAQFFLKGMYERNAEKAELLWDRYKDTYAPYEDAIIKENAKLVEPSGDLAMMSIAKQKELLGPTADFTLANVEREMRLMPFREGATRATLGLTTQQAQQRQAELGLGAGVAAEFYKEAGVGVEDLTKRRVGQAVAGVEGAFKGAETDIARGFSQFGIDPSSGTFKSAIRKVAMEKARAKSGAVTSARERAEQESFARKTTAMNVRAGAFAQPGVPGAIAPSVPLQSVGVPSGPGFEQPLRASTATSGLGVTGAGTLATTTKGQRTTTTGGDSGFGTALGTVGGILASKYIMGS